MKPTASSPPSVRDKLSLASPMFSVVPLCTSWIDDGEHSKVEATSWISSPTWIDVKKTPDRASCSLMQLITPHESYHTLAPLSTLISCLLLPMSCANIIMTDIGKRTIVQRVIPFLEFGSMWNLPHICRYELTAVSHCTTCCDPWIARSR